jgi:hypothetical protein
MWSYSALMHDLATTLHNFIRAYDLKFVEFRPLQGRDWMDSNFCSERKPKRTGRANLRRL